MESSRRDSRKGSLVRSVAGHMIEGGREGRGAPSRSGTRGNLVKVPLVLAGRPGWKTRTMPLPCRAWMDPWRASELDRVPS
jgi:hypothetical protein